MLLTAIVFHVLGDMRLRNVKGWDIFAKDRSFVEITEEGVHGGIWARGGYCMKCWNMAVVS